MSAQEVLNIQTSGGNIISFSYSEKPVITFEPNDVVKITAINRIVEFKFNEVAQIALGYGIIYPSGDVNNDNSVDIADIVSIVNYILGKPSSCFVSTMADMNNDGIIDVFDIMSIVNLIISNQGTGNYNARSTIDELEHISLKDDDLGIMLEANNTDRFVAFQFDVELSGESDLKNVRMLHHPSHILHYFKVEEGKYRVIGFSLNNDKLNSNLYCLLELSQISNSCDVCIDHVLFITPEEEIISFAGNQTVKTSIHDISNGQTNMVYDLSGRRISKDIHHLAKGVYIINGKAVIKQ